MPVDEESRHRAFQPPPADRSSRRLARHESHICRKCSYQNASGAYCLTADINFYTRLVPLAGGCYRQFNGYTMVRYRRRFAIMLYTASRLAMSRLDFHFFRNMPLLLINAAQFLGAVDAASLLAAALRLSTPPPRDRRSL